ncbi:hypothetical protein AC781_10070 [Akkermansia glycaniphila]|nr:hypothetical protein AC781_10070 [Akkermansia glycaniphila]
MAVKQTVSPEFYFSERAAPHRFPVPGHALPASPLRQGIPCANAPLRRSFVNTRHSLANAAMASTKIPRYGKRTGGGNRAEPMQDQTPWYS